MNNLARVDEPRLDIDIDTLFLQIVLPVELIIETEVLEDLQIHVDEEVVHQRVIEQRLKIAMVTFKGRWSFSMLRWLKPLLTKSYSVIIMFTFYRGSKDGVGQNAS